MSIHAGESGTTATGADLDAKPPSPSSATRATGLKADSIGLPHVLFQSITHMAPAVSLTFVLLTAVAFAGPVLPLTLIISLAVILCVATAIGQMAKEIPSAGGIYNYVANGIGPKAGFMVGWAYLVIEPLVAPLLFLELAFVLEDAFGQAHWHSGWLLWAVVGAVVIFALAYRDVRLSMRAGALLGAFEITIFIALAIWIIASTKGNTLAVFNPSHAPSGTFSGTFKGVVFSVIALVGFESAAPLGEEARNPRWTIPRGMVMAAVGLGVFYALTSYAWVVGTGFNAFVKTTGASPNPIRSLADQYWGFGWIAIIAALVTSVLANGNAAMNTASRIIYAMSRAGAMPAPFARTHPKYRTPYLAVIAQAALGLVLAIILGVAWGPATGLGILGTLIGILIILVYITVCVAAIAYFWRKRRTGWKGWNPWLHAILPALGALCFLPPLYYQYRPLPPYPLRWADWAAPVWLAIGLAVTWWFARNRPRALEEARAVYVAQDSDHADVVESVPLGVQPISR